MKIKAVITGATGMVGEGVLHECLLHPDVESVLVVNRRSCGISHPKLREVIHRDFSDLSPIAGEFSGYNACYFCAGVSSVGKKEEEYRHITYDLALHFAERMIKTNGENKVTFCYVSGEGTDSTEKGRLAWARIKGKTENDLLKLPFKSAFMYRPGLIKPIDGLKNTYRIYKILNPLLPLVERMIPKHMVKLEEIGRSMINVTLNGYSKKVLECTDIRKSGR